MKRLLTLAFLASMIAGCHEFEGPDSPTHPPGPRSDGQTAQIQIRTGAEPQAGSPSHGVDRLRNSKASNGET